MLQNFSPSAVVNHALRVNVKVPGANPGFLERAFKCIKLWGVGFAEFISLFLNIP